jgi:PAS domain-containing protein
MLIGSGRRDRGCKSQTIRNGMSLFNLDCHTVLIFQEFLFDQKTLPAYNPAMASVTRQCSQQELAKALDELRNSEKKLRQVIDTIPTLAWCNLPDGSNEFLNKRWHEYTALSVEESHGSGWQSAIHAEDRAPLC